jgi:hypothetical protein
MQPVRCLIIRTKNVNDSVAFDFFMYDPNGDACADCTYQVTVSPSEAVISSQDGNTVTGRFTVTKPGTYSLTIDTVYLGVNTTTRRVLFFVGDVGTVTTRYYISGEDTTHGQPHAADDAGSLIFSVPTNIESILCGWWIQNSPDEIPNYPLANLSNIDTYIWLKQILDDGAYIGVERYLTYSELVNVSIPVPALGSYSWEDNSFTGLSWGIDYPSSWYWLGLKLQGAAIYWVTFPSAEYINQPSYADFTYSYPINPAVKSSSNDNLLILSATEDSDNDASIVLNNPAFSATTTAIVLTSFNRPFFSVATNITSASSTSFTSPSVATTTDTTLESVNLAVTPSSGSVDIGITSWDLTGALLKKWTETSTGSPTVTHTVGDLTPGQGYNVWYDQLTGIHLLTKAIADSSGTITFSYDKGFTNTITFIVEKEAPATNNSGAPLPISTPASNGPLPTFPLEPGSSVTTTAPTTPPTTSTPAGSITPTPVSLYKSSTSPFIYVLTPNSYKRHIPNEPSFLSYNYTWNQIKDINQIDLNRYPLSNLIKLPLDSKVYLIDSTTKRWITDEQTFNNLQFNWLALSEVTPTEFDSYQTKDPITLTNYQQITPTFTTLLKKGDRNTNVTKLQAKLRSLGFFNHPYNTTLFGTVTEQALKDFQRYYRLSVTGVVDEGTRRRLNGV